MAATETPSSLHTETNAAEPMGASSPSAVQKRNLKEKKKGKPTGKKNKTKKREPVSTEQSSASKKANPLIRAILTFHSPVKSLQLVGAAFFFFFFFQAFLVPAKEPLTTFLSLSLLALNRWRFIQPKCSTCHSKHFFH